MQTTYRNYTINIGATERRDGSMATEACISVDYQPLHSLFVFLGQDALALEKAQAWIDAREGGALPVSALPIAVDPTYAQRRAAAVVERGRLDVTADEAEIARQMGANADSAHRVSVRYFGNAGVR